MPEFYALGRILFGSTSELPSVGEVFSKHFASLSAQAFAGAAASDARRRFQRRRLSLG
jgi:hypothetical protein